MAGKAAARKTRPDVSREDKSKRQPSRPARIFLLSPANIAGLRGKQILSEQARFDLALRLRAEGSPLGNVFSFISGLYFRGKLAYARAFADAPPKCCGVLVITSSLGLVDPESIVTIDDLRGLAQIPIAHTESRYRLPLERDARKLAALVGPHCEIVLLGSIASPKYVKPLLGIFGERLFFPAEFVGRGDMSRGGLMLRCVEAGTQLTYVPVGKAVRHGPRPPKLPKLSRPAPSSTNSGFGTQLWKP